MIKDLLVSFKDNIKTKTTNPFFGTLIAVWIIHNYKFVYTIFNFRASTGLDDRLTFIGTYLESDKFLPNLFWCIGYAILALVATYLLLNFSRLIVYTFNKKVTPRVNKITDSKSIVTIDVYDDQVAETKKFEMRYEEEQDAKLNLQNKYDALEKKYQDQLRLKEAREDFREPIDKEQTELRENLLENQLINKSVEDPSFKSYFVNKNAQSNGDHEVHKSGCAFKPNSESIIYLGDFLNCQDAMKSAKKHYSRVNGCYYCSNACHTS